MSEKSLTAYEDLAFAPIAEGSPVDVALLWGNPETGPAALRTAKSMPAGVNWWRSSISRDR